MADREAKDNSRGAGLGRPEDWKGHSPRQKIKEGEQTGGAGQWVSVPNELSRRCSGIPGGESKTEGDIQVWSQKKRKSG